MCEFLTTLTLVMGVQFVWPWGVKNRPFEQNHDLSLGTGIPCAQRGNRGPPPGGSVCANSGKCMLSICHFPWKSWIYRMCKKVHIFSENRVPENVQICAHFGYPPKTQKVGKQIWSIFSVFSKRTGYMRVATSTKKNAIFYLINSFRWGVSEGQNRPNLNK